MPSNSPLLPPFETMEPLLNVFAHFIDDEYDSEEELLHKARCASKEEAKEKLRENYGFYTGNTRAPNKYLERLGKSTTKAGITHVTTTANWEMEGYTGLEILSTGWI